MKLKFILFSILAMLVCTPFGWAYTVTFSDMVNHWPGWGNGSGDDLQDTIGTPNFTGGTVEIVNGYLAGLTFDQSSNYPSIYDLVAPGDLFINTSIDPWWDYVVDLTPWVSSGPNSSDPPLGSGEYNIYSVLLAVGDKNNNPGYILSGSDNTGSWTGFNIRHDHPVAWNKPDSSAPSGQVWFSGWNNDVNESRTFDFSGSEAMIPLGDSFIIGWGVNCANDVIYAEVSSVPEPGTMLLVGIGLICMAGFGRKKLFK